MERSHSDDSIHLIESSRPSSARITTLSSSSQASPVVSMLKTNAISSVARLPEAQSPSSGAFLGLGQVSAWQRNTLVGLMLGYVGFYFCRTNITLTINVILDSLPGVQKAEIGNILSVGYLSYAIGKAFQGVMIDKYGGRSVFVLCLLWTVLCTFILTLIPISYDIFAAPDGTSQMTYKVIDAQQYLASFGIVWCLLRFGQSGGWPSLIQVLSESFPAGMHGRVLGIASISYGVGDAFVRVFIGYCMSALSRRHFSSDDEGKVSVDNRISPVDSAFLWRQVFLIASISAFLLCMISWSLIRNTGNSFYTDLYKRTTQPKPKVSTLTTLATLVRMPKFWILIVLAMGITFIREAILTWGSVFLAEYVGIDYAQAAVLTLFFPFVGSLGSLSGGFILDRVQKRNRGFVLVSFLSMLSFIMLLASISTKPSPFSATLFLGFVAFALMAPFAYIESIFPLELIEGNSNTGITLGIVSFCGYLGAILAGHEVGFLAQTLGWPFVLQCIFSVSLVCLAFGVAWWRLDDTHYNHQHSSYESVRLK